MTTTIYLLRHGEVHNPEGIIYGRLPGYWLNEVGRGQVRTAGEFLAERGPFDALITSPLERARESAGIIAERLGLTPAVEPRLAETDVSGYQGQPFSALPRPDLRGGCARHGECRIDAGADARLGRRRQVV